MIRLIAVSLITASLLLLIPERMPPGFFRCGYIIGETGDPGIEKCKDPVCITFLRNCTFEIDGKNVTLKDGFADEKAGPGSASGSVTRYAGKNVTEDFNGDGKSDAMVILTRDTGGSGTFYYAAAAISSGKGYKGTNAIFLGDRIKIDSLYSAGGKICLICITRSHGDPMTSEPSVRITKCLEIRSGRLEEVIIPLITGKEWRWKETIIHNDSSIVPCASGDFSVSFSEDGAFSGKTDCNNFAGQFIQSGQKLQFGPIITTRKYCEGSRENDFLKYFSEAVSFSFSGEDSLILQLKDDNGSMIFEQVIVR
jgi:heat shock protein HslJ